MKIKRFVAGILAAVFMLCAFALMGCTDKKRALNDVEKAILGEWRDDIGTTRVFTADGMAKTSVGTFEFRQEGEGEDPEWGHYYVIKIDIMRDQAWFESRPDEMYTIRDDGTLSNSESEIMHRVKSEE